MVNKEESLLLISEYQVFGNKAEENIMAIFCDKRQESLG
jgi:hypothetical protein